MNYIKTKFNDFITEGKIIYDLGDYIYHQTSINNARNIISEGFKTGLEQLKGESNGGIWFAPTYKGIDGVNYTRDDTTNKRGMVEVSVRGLNFLDTKDIPNDDTLLSFKQPSYLLIQRIIQDDIFPISYDGVIRRGYTGGIYEVILRKEIANLNITGRILNTRGKEII